MSRTNIDIDEGLVRSVMERYHLKTKREAVDFALRRVAGPQLERDFLVGLEGSGWSGDLEELRSTRADERLSGAP
jgi:Arc/MetJ family transcription regulator